MHKQLSILSSTIKWILVAVLALLLAANCYGLIQRVVFGNSMPTLFGFGSAVVVSDSMEPEISRGDVILIHARETYAEGDVVTFYDSASDSYTTHRIIEVRSDTYLTQGDSNDSPDAPIRADQIVGRVWLVIPGVGGVLAWLQQPIGLLVVLLIGVLLIFLPDLLGVIRRRFPQQAGISDGEEQRLEAETQSNSVASGEETQLDQLTAEENSEAQAEAESQTRSAAQNAQSGDRTAQPTEAASCAPGTDGAADASARQSGADSAERDGGEERRDSAELQDNKANEDANAV